ncbi:MAG: tail fiber domain-containing protein [Candidatus Hydrogenedentota bacterium]
MKTIRNRIVWLCCIIAISASMESPAYGAEESQNTDPAIAHILPDGIVWEPQIQYTSVTVSVSQPDGNVTQEVFTAGVEPSFSIGGHADGAYTYELRFQTTKKASRKKVATDEPAQVYSGYFSIVSGSIANEDQEGPLMDTVVPNDLIVNNNLCVGIDCADGEGFSGGLDTLLLKQNNLRLKFWDTSDSLSFPTTDWQITINDTINGGAERFSIDDVTNATTPLTIEGSAPSHSLYVDDIGRVGMGTSTPSARLHLITSDEAQTELARFENASGSNADVTITLVNAIDSWTIGINGSSNRMELRRANDTALSIDSETLVVAANHGLISEGIIHHASDRNKKDSFENIKSTDVLDKVLQMPITQWKFKTEDESIRHIGPTSQDFMSAFGYGTNEKYIDTVDADGVALAAIQGLNHKLQVSLAARDDVIAKLLLRIEALETAQGGE